MDEDEEANEWLLVVGILLGIFFVLCCILCCLTRCVTGCVRPENTKGPWWSPKPITDKEGEAGTPSYVTGNLDGKLSWFFRLNEQTAPAGDQLYPSVAPHSVPSVRA